MLISIGGGVYSAFLNHVRGSASSALVVTADVNGQAANINDSSRNGSTVELNLVRKDVASLRSVRSLVNL